MSDDSLITDLLRFPSFDATKVIRTVGFQKWWFTFFSSEHVEFPQKTPYPNSADAFVRLDRREFPAGGEMSGLTAHFLFGAKNSF
jgi:hypothetical protein